MFSFMQTVQLVSETGESQQSPARVTNPQIAEVLFNIATLLEMQQANPYRIAAYRNAATLLMQRKESVAAAIQHGEPIVVPGIGDRLRRKITELVLSGRMMFYDDLCEESLPDDVRELMRVPQVGPRTALRLSGQLGIHSVRELCEAAESQRLREYYGFGPRRERSLADAARAVIEGRVPPAVGGSALPLGDQTAAFTNIAEHAAEQPAPSAA